MFNFLFKGIYRDKSRSIFPLLVVSSGVLVIVFMLAFMNGYKDGMIRQNARYDTGHVKIVSRAYEELINQKPYDLALLDTDVLLLEVSELFPELDFVERINFAALLDVPDETGNTQEQGNVIAYGVDLLNSDNEIKNFQLKESLIKGRLPKKPDEILLSNQSFKRLNLSLDDTVTLIGSTIYGSMSFYNFKIVGTINFGIEMLDRGGVFVDIETVRSFLDLENGASEILGFF